MKTRVRIVIGVLLVVFVVINIVLILTQREAGAPVDTATAPDVVVTNPTP